MAVSDISNIQLELGSTATEYEPYNPNHTVYGGWVDLITGEVQEEWAYAECNDKTLWEEMTNNTCDFYYTHSFTGRKRFDTSYQGLISSSFLIDNTKNAYMRWVGTGSDKVGIRNRTTSYTLADIQQMAENGDISICYKLATPITYHLALTTLQTFLGQNNVWSNADYVEVEYDLHETQDILARKQFIIANQPHIAKPAAAPLQNFVTDVPAPLKECKVHFAPVQDLHGYDRPWVGGAGKNLFNINSVEQDPDNISYSNENKRIFTSNTYFSGSSYSNYWYPQKVSSYSIQQNSITVDSSGGYGVGFAVAVTEGNYYLSWVLSGEGYANVTLYKTDGTAVIISNGGSNPSFTIPNDVNIIVITFRNKTSGTPATFNNIQLEKGSTATSYEPYENVCPISGWTGINATISPTQQITEG